MWEVKLGFFFLLLEYHQFNDQKLVLAQPEYVLNK